MPVFWPSNPRPLREVVVRLAVLAGFLALATPAIATARTSPHPATSSATTDSIAPTRADSSPGAEVKIGSHGVTVSVDTDRNRKVVVVGPQIAVDEDGGVFRLFTDVEVPAGQRVDGDVVTVFGSSKIEGHVTGNAVAVFGSVTLGTNSVVDGDLVAVFGGVHRRDTAVVGGETVDFGFEPLIPGWPALPTVLLVIGVFWLLSLIGGWIVSLVMPGRLVRITATASRRMGSSLLVGIAVLPSLILTQMLLLITVVGIPVALLLPIAFGFVMAIGQYAGLYGLGQKLMRRRLQQGSVFAGIAVGTLFVALFFTAATLLAGHPGFARSLALFLFAVGCLISLSLQVIGGGAVLLSRFGTRPPTLEPEVAPVTAPISASTSAASPLGT